MADRELSNDDLSSRQDSAASVGGTAGPPPPSGGEDPGDFEYEGDDGVEIEGGFGSSMSEEQLGGLGDGDNKSRLFPTSLEKIADEKGDSDEEGVEDDEIVTSTIRGAGDKIAASDAGTTKKKEMVTALWPELEEKFRPADVQKLVEKIVKEQLDGQAYDADEMPRMIKVLSDLIHSKVRLLKYKRYKIITHVSLGERRGGGITSVTRCIWDPMADCMATYSYLNETVFCCVTVYGIYYY